MGERGVLERSREPARRGGYLERKQSRTVAVVFRTSEYPRELQRVRMVLGHSSCVRRGPEPCGSGACGGFALVKCHLRQPDKDADGNPLPLRPARVPWFGYQLFAGNSLIGARREVFRAGSLKKAAKPAWHEEVPRRLNVQRPDRAPDEIYHFLLPDPGMARYTDKVAKALYPEDFERLSRWHKEFCRPLEDHEISRFYSYSWLDQLWAENTEWSSGIQRARRTTLRRGQQLGSPYAEHTEAREGSDPPARALQRRRRFCDSVSAPQAGDGLLVRALVLAYSDERGSPQS